MYDLSTCRINAQNQQGHWMMYSMAAEFVRDDVCNPETVLGLSFLAL